MTSTRTAWGGAGVDGCIIPVSFPPGPGLARRVSPGRPPEVARVRRWLAGLLPDVPARDDVLTIAVELVTNAIKHTASGQGGTFMVEVRWQAEPPAVRVTVADGGAPTGPRWPTGPPSGLESHGMGLRMVRFLAARAGVSGGRRGRRVWAEVSWAGRPHNRSLPGPARAGGTGGERA